MAKCSVCGKTTTYGLNRPWSKKATRREFRPNLHKVAVLEGGRKKQVLMCARCMRTSVKTPA